MATRTQLVKRCGSLATALSLASAAAAGGPDPGICLVFFDQGSFEAFNGQTGKLLKGVEDFDSASNLPQGSIAALNDPLQGNVPNVNSTGLGFPMGLVNKNLLIQSNVLGINAPVPAPRGKAGLAALGANSLGPDTPTA